MGDFSYSKKEKLKKRKDISKVFNKGKKLLNSPILLIYIPSDSLKVAFIVPKKKIRGSVVRNTLKRRMRESYRLQKNLMSSPYELIFMFINKEPMSYSIIYEAVSKCLTSLPHQI